MNPLRFARLQISTPRRVVIAIVVLVLAGFTVSGFIAVHTLEDQLTNQLDHQLIDGARSIRTAIDTLSVESIEQLTDMPRPSSDSAILVLNSTGEVIYSAPVERAGKAVPLPKVPAAGGAVEHSVPFTTEATNSALKYRAVSVPTATGSTVVVAGPLDGVRATVNALNGRIAVVGGVVFAVLAFLIWAVVANSNHQLDHLVETATQIGQGDLSARVELPSNDIARRLSDALNVMTAQLETAFAARQESENRLRRFAADASHELRTPLTHIRGYAELLRSGAATDPEDQKRAASRIEAEAIRMAGLVDDLLQLARLDQERLLESVPVDLRELLVDSVSDARTADPERTYSVDVPDGPVIINGDSAALRQVLSNLLANVRTHTAVGASASATLDEHSGEAVIILDDTGPGMTEDAAVHAFDRFYRPEDSRSRSTGGSGLGLAIVKSIVEAHGGTVALESSLADGTKVKIVVPTIGDSERGA